MHHAGGHGLTDTRPREAGLLDHECLRLRLRRVSSKREVILAEPSVGVARC